MEPNPISAAPTDDLSPIEDAAVAARLAAWLPEFPTRDPFVLLQLRHLVVESIRLDRLFNEEEARRRSEIVRARTCWETDRRLEVERIAAKLHRNPSRRRAELLATSEGCRWMIREWTLLREPLSRGEAWDERRSSHALDLLGISGLHREGASRRFLCDGSPERLLALIDENIADLQYRVERLLEPAEQDQRDLTLRGLTLSFDPETQALRRTIAGCERRFLALVKLLMPYRRSSSEPRATSERPERATPPPRSPSWPTSPASRPQSSESVRFHPPQPTPDAPNRPRTNETERRSSRTGVAPASDSAGSGNRRERRRAAALARKAGR
ncbi:MAG: hypothetical protein SFX72_06960 [Isosphaeraceae bacterium]|nr:hypothetical protein [Isosphaeraceae bacterium]